MEYLFVFSCGGFFGALIAFAIIEQNVDELEEIEKERERLSDMIVEKMNKYVRKQ